MDLDLSNLDSVLQPSFFRVVLVMGFPVLDDNELRRDCCRNNNCHRNDCETSDSNGYKRDSQCCCVLAVVEMFRTCFLPC